MDLLDHFARFHNTDSMPEIAEPDSQVRQLVLRLQRCKYLWPGGRGTWKAYRMQIEHFERTVEVLEEVWQEVAGGLQITQFQVPKIWPVHTFDIARKVLWHHTEVQGKLFDFVECFKYQIVVPCNGSMPGSWALFEHGDKSQGYDALKHVREFGLFLGITEPFDQGNIIDNFRVNVKRTIVDAIGWNVSRGAFAPLKSRTSIIERPEVRDAD